MDKLKEFERRLRGECETCSMINNVVLLAREVFSDKPCHVCGLTKGHDKYCSVSPEPPPDKPIEGSEYCQCVYESDCHGIEMIKTPSGKECARGVHMTDHRSVVEEMIKSRRGKYSPWTCDLLDDEQLEALHALLADSKELERVRGIIADDSYAISFQSLSQYRQALLAKIHGGKP